MADKDEVRCIVITIGTEHNLDVLGGVDIEIPAKELSLPLPELIKRFIEPALADLQARFGG